MPTFGESLRTHAKRHGMSLRALARAIPVDPGYLSKVARDLQIPSSHVAARLDLALHADGDLIRVHEQAVTRAHPPAHEPHVRPWDATDVAHIREEIAHLVALDTARGGEDLYKVALRAFAAAAKRLTNGTYRPEIEHDLQAAVAELGQVAAWLAYDAEDQPASRQVATDAAMIARLAGDTAMERFILSHLSMQAAYLGHGRQALLIADKVLDEQPVSNRLSGMFELRRARGLAALGGATDALASLNRARLLLSDTVGPQDPAWTGWLHEAEMSVHEGRIRAAGGDLRGAVDLSRRAVEVLPARQGRDWALYRAWLLHDLVRAGGWVDTEAVAVELADRVGGIGSARVPRILCEVCAELNCGLKVPRRVVDAVRAARDQAAGAVRQPSEADSR